MSSRPDYSQFNALFASTRFSSRRNGGTKLAEARWFASGIRDARDCVIIIVLFAQKNAIRLNSALSYRRKSRAKPCNILSSLGRYADTSLLTIARWNDTGIASMILVAARYLLSVPPLVAPCQYRAGCDLRIREWKSMFEKSVNSHYIHCTWKCLRFQKKREWS